jgi:hypothetical protein
MVAVSNRRLQGDACDPERADTLVGQRRRSLDSANSSTHCLALPPNFWSHLIAATANPTLPSYLQQIALGGIGDAPNADAAEYRRHPALDQDPSLERGRGGYTNNKIESHQPSFGFGTAETLSRQIRLLRAASATL